MDGVSLDRRLINLILAHTDLLAYVHGYNLPQEDPLEIHSMLMLVEECAKNKRMEFTPEKLTKLRKAFDYFDEDGSGRVRCMRARARVHTIRLHPCMCAGVGPNNTALAQPHRSFVGIRSMSKRSCMR